MVKQQEICKCGTKYWTSVIKVFVFKQRLCAKCKTQIKFGMDGTFQHWDENEEFVVCTKCGKKYKPEEVESLPVRMMGTSRNFLKAEEMREKGFEVQTVYVPKNRKCQRCRNLQNIIQNYAKKAKMKRKKKPHTLTEEEERTELQRAILQLHRKEWQERKREERLKTQKKEQEALMKRRAEAKKEDEKREREAKEITAAFMIWLKTVKKLTPKQISALTYQPKRYMRLSKQFIKTLMKKGLLKDAKET